MMRKINKVRIFFITIALSIVGILPKIIKASYSDNGLLAAYFFYIGACFLSFYSINQLIWRINTKLSYWIKYGIGFMCGFILLFFIHLLIINFQTDWLIYFLNIKKISFLDVTMITCFRAFIIQSVAFVCLYFLKNWEEKIAFQTEIDLLNQYLSDLKNHTIAPKEYKTSIITRFQDKILPIEVNDIAFFYLVSGTVLQHLFDQRKYIQSISLESLENDLNPAIFYRANRQFLIHRKAVEKIEQIEHRKLKVILTLPTPEEVIVSKVKSSAFIKWLEAT